MQTTSNRAIPYYEPGDPADLAYITQAIATKVDAILGKRTYLLTIPPASAVNGTGLGTIAIPAQATATRVQLRFIGLTGFSASANQIAGMNVTADAGALVSQIVNQGVRCAESGQWYAFVYAGYIDLPANTATTVTVTAAITGGGNAYYRGDFTAQILQPGEY